MQLQRRLDVQVLEIIYDIILRQLPPFCSRVISSPGAIPLVMLFIPNMINSILWFIWMKNYTYSISHLYNITDVLYNIIYIIWYGKNY